MDLVCSNTIAQEPFVCKSGKSLMEVANFFPVGFDTFSTGGNLHLIHKTQLKTVTEELIDPTRGVTVDGLLNGYDMPIKIHSIYLFIYFY